MKIEVEIPDTAVRGQHGVYVAFDGDGEALYIGRSSNLPSRLQNHRSQSEWFRQMRSIEWTPCDGTTEARTVEKSLIHAFRPDMNVNDRKELAPSVRQKCLPDWTAAKLVGLYEAGAGERLNNYILALHNAGWTRDSIGYALSMTREAVRLRENKATRADPSPGIPDPPEFVRKPRRSTRVRPTVPMLALIELRALQAQAQTVRGWTPLDAPERAASERFSELLAQYVLDGVTVYRLSKQLGVTCMAITARLARHGYTGEVKGLPQVKYGTPYVPHAEKTRCKDGHELAGDNLYLVNGDPRRRVCRECDSRRHRESYARRKARAS